MNKIIIYNIEDFINARKQLIEYEDMIFDNNLDKKQIFLFLYNNLNNSLDNNYNCYLADCYFYGIGVESDKKKAVEYYNKAATYGDMLAKYQLGRCYYYGDGVLKGFAHAASWFSKAASQGHIEAQYFIGYFYENGFGVKQNYEKAIYWYTESAKQGNAKSQYRLATCYYFGKGIEKNCEKAIYWYTESAKQGNIDAKADLMKYNDNTLKEETIQYQTDLDKNFQNSQQKKHIKFTVED